MGPQRVQQATPQLQLQPLSAPQATDRTFTFGFGTPKPLAATTSTKVRQCIEISSRSWHIDFSRGRGMQELH